MSDIAPTPSNQFSFSKVKTFNQCPLRYRYRYLMGRKEAFRSIESYLGNVVHDVLQWLYEQREGPAEISVDDSLDEFARRWHGSWTDDIAVVRLTDTADDAHRIGRVMLEGFHRNILCRDRSRTVALEQRYSLRLSDEVVFTGFADRVGRTEKGQLFVVDYKTSKSEGNPSEFSEGLQAPLYAACAIENLDEPEALAGYHYLRMGTTRWQRVTRERARSLLDRFLALTREATAAAEFPARPGILCAWCGFNHLCPEAVVPEGLAGGRQHAERLERGDSPPGLG
jgi:putative RecB family exonuclease